jgi:hypothetical protein
MCCRLGLHQEDGRQVALQSRQSMHLNVSVLPVQAADVQQRLHPIQPALTNACKHRAGRQEGRQAGKKTEIGARAA